MPYQLEINVNGKPDYVEAESLQAALHEADVQDKLGRALVCVRHPDGEVICSTPQLYEHLAKLDKSGA